MFLSKHMIRCAGFRFYLVHFHSPREDFADRKERTHFAPADKRSLFQNGEKFQASRIFLRWFFDSLDIKNLGRGFTGRPSMEGEACLTDPNLTGGGHKTT